MQTHANINHAALLKVLFDLMFKRHTCGVNPEWNAVKELRLNIGLDI